MSTKPRQFRLTEDTLAELDAIAEHLERETGTKQNRSTAIPYAARQIIKQIAGDKKPKKKTSK